VFRSRFWFAPSVLLALALAPSTAEACVCRGPVPACQRAWEYPAVFVAHVRQFLQTTERDTLDLEVTETFRGVETGPLRMSIRYSSCSQRFEEGRSYLIYAHDEGGFLSTGRCSGNLPVEEAADDLAYLRGLSSLGQPTAGEVRGTAHVIGPKGDQRTVLPGLLITITGSGTAHDVRTDPDGRFSLRLPVDTYVVHAQVPAGMAPIPSGMSTQLRDTRGCAVANVFLQRVP
jgi:hypothetical protein